MTARIHVTPGDRYGWLTVIREVDPHIRQCGRRRRKVACECDCGNQTVVLLQSLRCGDNVSCGCFGKRKSITHGRHDTRTYQAWHSMRQRCLNALHRAYPSYGGRGITICRRWLDSFEAFLKDMGERPDNRSLDRIDNDGNYKPDNCRWATCSEQQRNTRANRLLTHNGMTKCVSEWAENTGIHRATIRGRLRIGWTVTDALTTPPGTRRRRCEY
jgi:hypothetical protein